MGDAKSGPVRLAFNSQLRVEFHGATVTSDAGLLLPRELDERLGLSTLIERHLADPQSTALAPENGPCHRGERARLASWGVTWFRPAAPEAGEHGPYRKSRIKSGMDRRAGGGAAVAGNRRGRMLLRSRGQDDPASDKRDAPSNMAFAKKGIPAMDQGTDPRS